MLLTRISSLIAMTFIFYFSSKSQFFLAKNHVFPHTTPSCVFFANQMATFWYNLIHFHYWFHMAKARTMSNTKNTWMASFQDTTDVFHSRAICFFFSLVFFSYIISYRVLLFINFFWLPLSIH